jgi:hypothetical protein
MSSQRCHRDGRSIVRNYIKKLSWHELWFVISSSSSTSYCKGKEIVDWMRNLKKIWWMVQYYYYYYYFTFRSGFMEILFPVLLFIHLVYSFMTSVRLKKCVFVYLFLSFNHFFLYSKDCERKEGWSTHMCDLDSFCLYSLFSYIYFVFFILFKRASYIRHENDIDRYIYCEIWSLKKKKEKKNIN